MRVENDNMQTTRREESIAQNSVRCADLEWPPSNGLRFSGAAPIDGKSIVADTGAKKRTISLDAKRRPLQARVSLQHSVI